MKNNKPLYGFTLIELMIVVAIIGVLAGVALPAYQQYAVRTHRADAEKTLLEVTQYLERYFTEVGSYTGAAVPTGLATSPQESSDVIYNIAFATGTPTSTTYTLLATPTGGQSTADTECAILSINSANVKCIKNQTKCSNSGTSSVKDEVAACW